MTRKLASLVLALVCLMSCATRTALKSRPEALLASLYQEGSVLVCVDAHKEPDLVLQTVGDSRLAKRIDRVSLVLSEDHYPLDEASGLTMLVEGDFPSFAFGIVLGRMEGYVKQKGGYWQGPRFAIGLLEKNLVLVTNLAWEAEAGRIKTQKFAYDPLIGSALRGPIGIYAKHPSTFFPMQFDLSDALRESVDTVTVLLERKAKGLVGDVSILMEDEAKASALSKLIRSAYVRTLRSRGKAVDVAKLRAMFTLHGNLLTMNQMELPDADLPMLQVTF